MTFADPRQRLISAVSAVFLFSLVFVIGDATFAWQESEIPAKVDPEVAKLIEKLGDTDFATRQKAQQDLAQLGLKAFDALYDAQTNEDIEIAMRARYLVRGLQITWYHDNDSAEVKRILRSYGKQNLVERGNSIVRLGQLEDGAGVPALARLARFDGNEMLSKQAALRVLRQTPLRDTTPRDKTNRAKMARVIRDTIGRSKRPGGQWLKAYADTLEDSAGSLGEWERLTKREYDNYTQFPERSSQQIVRDLLRWHAELLRRHDRSEEATVVMRRTVELLDGTRDQILETVNWLMKNEAWAVVGELAEQYWVKFEEDPLLMYRVAESYLRAGKMEDAERVGAQAAKLLPVEAGAHVVAAYELQEDGLLHWAEREFRYAIKLGQLGSLEDLRARILLSEMLHDSGKEKPAAQVLEDAAQVLVNDESVAETMRKNFGREPGEFLARMHYFHSQHHAAAGEAQQARQSLEKAIKHYPNDADVLIAMHHMKDAGMPWRVETKRRIDIAVGHFRDQIAKYEKEIVEAPSEPLKAYARRGLAMANNQFAWLVGNTEGDFDEAIRASQKSLALRPGTGGYYDTLARCYFAKGDLENAIKSQRKAASLEPHSGQIQRQLELFQKTLAEHQMKNGAQQDAPSSKESSEDADNSKSQ